MKKSLAEENASVDEATPLKKRVVRSQKKAKSLPLFETKWVVLTLCCAIMASMYYILAMPAALHRQLHARMPNENFEMNFNLLFTVSYFPNMVLPMFGGVIVDKYGEAKCLVAFCIVVFLGQAIAAVGVSSISWKLMLTGRLVFGLGAQNLIVANASLISKWFAGNEGVALGLSNVCSYAGVIATNIASPHLANSVSPAFAFWLGVIAEVVAIVLGSVVVVMDRSKKDQESETLVCSPMFSPISYRHSFSSQTLAITGDYPAPVSSPGVTFRNSDSSLKTDTSSGIGKLRSFKPSFWLLCVSFLLIYGVVWSFTNVSSGILLERDFFLQAPMDCIPTYPDQCTSGSLAPTDGNPGIDSQGNTCPVGSHFAPVIPESLHSTKEETDYSFENLKSSDIRCQDNFWSKECTADYCQEQATATEKAGFFMSIPYFFTVALTFHLGLFSDKTGFRTEMICVGSVLLVFAHLLLAYPSSLSPPVVPLVGQGLGYTICVAALWPSVPFTVSEDSVGFAFGIMMGVQNVGLAVIPLIVAQLYKLGDDHYLPMVEVFFAICSVVAVIVGVALWMADRKTGGILGTPRSAIRYSEEDGMVVVKAGHRRTKSEGIIAPRKSSV